MPSASLYLHFFHCHSVRACQCIYSTGVAMGGGQRCLCPLHWPAGTPVLPTWFWPDTGFPVHSAALHNSQAEWLTPNRLILVPLLSVHLNSSMPIFIGRDFFKHWAYIYTCSNTSSFSADLIYQSRIVPLYNNLKHVNSFIWVRQQVQVRPSVC